MKFITKGLAVCLMLALLSALGGCRKKISQDGTESTFEKDTVSVVSETDSRSDDSSNSFDSVEKGGQDSSDTVKQDASSRASNPMGYTESHKENSSKTENLGTQSSASVSTDGSSKDTETEDTSSKDTAESEELSLPTVGYQLDERLRVKAVAASDGTVTVEIENISKLWTPEEDASVYCICKDKNNKQIKKEKIALGSIECGSFKAYSFSIPKSTVKVEFSGLEADYWSVTA